MKRPILTSIFLLLIMQVSLVYASDDETVNLGDLPQQLADALGVSLFVGQLLASSIIICLFLFPTLMLSGYYGGASATVYTGLIVGLVTAGICVGLGWLPVWLFAVTCLLIAVLMGSKFANMMGGEKT